MKPSSRRRVEREIQGIVRTDGDRCSLCHADFLHNSRTFGGVTPVGVSALVGQCCRAKLGEAILSGVYVNQDFGELPPANADGRTRTSADLESTIMSLQHVFDEREALRGKVARRAGVDPKRTKLFLEGSLWKTADASWFEANPGRSHRLRPLIGAEAASFGSIADERMPARHELQVLVRQVEPGQRIRIPFGRNLDTPIPDDEAALHALFDVVTDQRENPGVSTDQVLRKMKAYKRPSASKPS